MTRQLNFGWVIEKLVAACAAPLSDGDLQYLSSHGITAIVRLAHAATDKFVMRSDQVRGHNLEDLHEPVRDFASPSQEQVTRILEFVRDRLNQGNPVAISCGAGCGRTGTIITCLLVTRGYTADDALAYLIAKRPCSREIVETTPSQRQAILDFEERFRLIG